MALVKFIPTKSRKVPRDIAVTRCGDLVYTDNEDSSINIVEMKRIQTLITLTRTEWRPRGLCCTFSGDLLVIIESRDGKQAKVVHYSGSKEKQSIQWDDHGQPLYSTGRLFNYEYIAENRNFDICVADNKACISSGAVIVVNAVGRLRFRYTGPFSTSKGSFDPLGITTDSKGRILIADYCNHRIHIVDQDGELICYIKNCHLEDPCGICVDSKDNLFVAEVTGKVIKIQMYN
ncbi:uncharacterized protein LOC111132724 [Crassostrea virginica]